MSLYCLSNALMIALSASATAFQKIRERGRERREEILHYYHKISTKMQNKLYHGQNLHFPKSVNTEATD